MPFARAWRTPRITPTEGSEKRSRFDQAFGVVEGAEAFGLDGAAGAGGVEEFAAAEVEADVGDAASGGVEEDEVAALQFAGADGAAGGGHVAGAARQVDADGVFVNVLHHAAAIEASVAAAAPAVGRADEVEAVQHEFLSAGGAADVADADGFGRGGAGGLGAGGVCFGVFGGGAAGSDEEGGGDEGEGGVFHGYGVRDGKGGLYRAGGAAAGGRDGRFSDGLYGAGGGFEAV